MSVLKKTKLSGIFLCLTVTVILAGNTDTVSIQTYELLLDELFSNTSKNTADYKKEKINEQIIVNLEKILSTVESFYYPFDSLTNLGKITSPDSAVRIYTWNLPYSDGSHKYFGFIQYKPAVDNNIRLFKLEDKSETIKHPETLIMSDTNWFGALYYEILENVHNNKRYYTILGFDFNTMMTNKKIIEILYFSKDNKPVFGSPVFSYNNDMKNRIIFEYSTKAAMGLKYNDELEMIVFDHLSPTKPSYVGRYMFYGPDFSYDGLKFENGIWNEVKDVDVRNTSY